MLPLAVVVILLILAVFAIFILFGVIKPFGERAQDFDFSDRLPGRDGAIPALTVEFDPDVKQAYERLLKILKNPPDGPCIADYGGFADLKGHRIVLSREDGKGSVRVINNKQQLAALSPFDAELCVVGGTIRNDKLLFHGLYRVADLDDVGSAGNLDGNQFRILRDAFSYTEQQLPLAAPHFYTNWIREFTPQQAAYRSYRQFGARLLAPDFTPAEMVVLPAAGGISYSGATTNKKDPGLLYVPEKGKVCFFALFGGDKTCNAAQEGLDDDCIFSEKDDWFGEEHNLPYRLRNGEVPSCAFPRAR